MAWRDWGNPPINSTTGPQATPSTAVLMAELDSTQLGTKDLVAGQKKLVTVTWIVGGDTNANWQLETCTSTALGAGVDMIFPKTPTNQSAQYVTCHELFKDYRIRARVAPSTMGNGGAAMHAYISAEVLT